MSEELPRLSDERFKTTAPISKIADLYFLEQRKLKTRGSLKRLESSIYPALRWVGDRILTPSVWEEWTASREGAMATERRQVSSFFNWMIGKGYVLQNPIGHAKPKLLTAGRRLVRRVIPYNDWLRVLLHFRDSGQFDFEWCWGCGYECAFSLADSLMVSWDEIDLSTLVITRVRHKMRTRTSTTCSVPVDPGGEFAKTLERAVTRRRFQTHTFPNWPGKKEYVLPGQVACFKLHGFLDQGLNEQLKLGQRAAGIEAVPMHSLRFARLTLLANGGIIPATVMARMSGHASVEMLQQYIAPDMGLLREAQTAANRLAAAQPARLADGKEAPKQIGSGPT